MTKEPEPADEIVVSVSVPEILRLALEMHVDGKTAADWMETRVPAVGNRRPLELLDTPEGRYQVWVALQRAAYGVW